MMCLHGFVIVCPSATISTHQFFSGTETARTDSRPSAHSTFVRLARPLQAIRLETAPLTSVPASSLERF